MKKTIYISTLVMLLIPIFFLKAEDRIGEMHDDMHASSGPRMMRGEMRADAKNDRHEMRKDMKVNMKMKLDTRRVQLKADIDALKAKKKDVRAKRLDEKAKARVEIRLGNIYKRLTERIDNIARVDAGITKRLTAYTAAQVSVASVTTLQTSAQALLAKARVDVEATKALSETELNATTTKESLRALVHTAEASIKTATESYRKVLDALKMLPKLKVEATTTATTTL